MSAGGGLEAVAVLLPSVPVSVKEKQQLWDQFDQYIVGIQKPNVSGFRMVKNWLDAKWSSFCMVDHSTSDLRNVRILNESGF